MAELFLIVRLAGARIALAAEQVEAVVEIGAVAPVPRAPAHVAGLAALRSRVLTVIDASVLVDPERRLAGEAREAVTATVAGHAYALLVDGVEDVIEGIPAEPGLPLAEQWRLMSRGTIEAGGDLLLLADVEALVAGLPATAARAA